MVGKRGTKLRAGVLPLRQGPDCVSVYVSVGGGASSLFFGTRLSPLLLHTSSQLPRNPHALLM